MNKKKDIQTLEKIVKLLKETFKSIMYDIEDQEEMFNSDKALEVIDKYYLITASLDDLLYQLFNYFEELVFIHKEK